MLITGCNGLLGQKLTTLASDDYAIYGLGLREQSPVRDFLRHYIQLDITDQKEVLTTIQNVQPEWVINTAAVTDVDACELELERAFEVNVGGLRNLSEGCERYGAKFLQLSTNYVFNGTSSPYSEEDALSPVNVYGRTKMESEGLLQRSGLDSIIIRTVLLYGSVPDLRPNFVHWVCSNLERGERIRAATDLFSNPTLIDDLALGILTAIKKGARGMYHMAGSEALSRYDFALKIAQVFGLDSTFIIPVQFSDLGLSASRPLSCCLNTDRVRDELGLIFHSVDGGLSEMIGQSREDEER